MIFFRTAIFGILKRYNINDLTKTLLLTLNTEDFSFHKRTKKFKVITKQSQGLLRYTSYGEVNTQSYTNIREKYEMCKVVMIVLVIYFTLSLSSQKLPIQSMITLLDVDIVGNVNYCI